MWDNDEIIKVKKNVMLAKNIMHEKTTLIPMQHKVHVRVRTACRGDIRIFLQT